MNAPTGKHFLFSTALAAAGLLLGSQATAQTLTNLHNFVLSQGGFPYAGLILSGDTLYGTTDLGGVYGGGTVFSITTNGGIYNIVHSFTNTTDGENPGAGVILSGNTLYGTTFNGGISSSAGYGTVFSVGTDGSDFTTLYSFTDGSDGAYPRGGLLLSGGSLFGTTGGGSGSSAYGIIYGLTVSAATGPALAIVLSGTNVVLTWTTNAGVFNLESTPSLAAPTIWSVVSSNAPVVNGEYTVTNGISGAQTFCQLQQ
jgi:uncharacterized repeat protein (TIGR03803 family)